LSQHRTVKIPYDLAIDVYESFIVRGADMEVNISDEVRSKIYKILVLEETDDMDYKRCGSDLQLGDENNMRALTGKRASFDQRGRGRGKRADVAIDIFDEAQNEVFALMESDSLPRFKNSKLLKNFMSAMSSSFGEEGGRGIELVASARNILNKTVRRNTVGEEVTGKITVSSERMDRSEAYGIRSKQQSSQSERFLSKGSTLDDIDVDLGLKRNEIRQHPVVTGLTSPIGQAAEMYKNKKTSSALVLESKSSRL